MAHSLHCVLLGHKSKNNSRIVNFYLQSYWKWPVAVKSFKEHAKPKPGKYGDSKNLFDRFLDRHKGREVPVNKMVDSNYKTNDKNAR